jgi:hypothetical protein
MIYRPAQQKRLMKVDFHRNRLRWEQVILLLIMTCILCILLLIDFHRNRLRWEQARVLKRHYTVTWTE